MEEDIRDLLIKTMLAGALGVAGAEAARFGFERLMKRHFVDGSKFSSQVHDFTHSALSAFILILTSYEKAVLLWSGMRRTFFLLTFILCIIFSRIFASAEPSPFFPLKKHWKKIFFSRAVRKTNSRRRQQFSWKTPFNMIAAYAQLAWPSLLGQSFGLMSSVKWMKTYWDGWLTSHHVTYLPLLDDCMICLNTNFFLGFLLETGITFAFLNTFDFIDNINLSHEGAKKILTSQLGRNGLKSAVVIFSMYLFIDVTGSFANPFQALAMQRHCFTDSIATAKLIFVYVIGPFLGTVSFLLWTRNNKDLRDSKRKA